ncbi:MAG: NYN domain-containing protein, partial [Patescibacteria group bacterium]
MLGSRLVNATNGDSAFVVGARNGSGVLTEQLTMLSTGYVGIGTTTPAAPLHVVGQCVTGDTKLRRKRRRKGKNDEWIEEENEVAIKDIQAGDEIASLDEATGRIVWSKVNALLDMGVKTTYRLKTEDGREIRTTAEHPYLAQNTQGRSPRHPSPIPGAGWLTVADIRKGDFIAVPKPKLGVFIDDANMFYAQRNAGWRVDYAKLKMFWETLFDVRFVNYYLTIPGKRDSAFLRTQAFVRELRRAYGDFMEIKSKSLKYIRDEENLAYKKKGSMDAEIVVDIMGRLAELDAVIVVSGDSDYIAAIAPVLQGRKKILFMGFEENMAWELRQRQHVYFDKIQSMIGLGEQKNAPAFRTGVPLLTPLYSPGAFLSNPVGDNSDMVWAKVSSIEKVGEEQVYDIEIEGTHNFIGNDIVAHNTFISGNVGIATTTPSRKLSIY